MMWCHFCFLFINCFSFLSLVWMCNTYPRLSSSCSSGSELYALSRHRVLQSCPLHSSCFGFGWWWRPFNDYAIHYICYQFNVMGTCWRNNCRQRNAFLVCQNVPFCAQFASVWWDCFRSSPPPKATLWICYLWIAMSSWYPLHHHRILSIDPCLFENIQFIPFLEPSVTGRTRTKLWRQHLPLASCSRM